MHTKPVFPLVVGLPDTRQLCDPGRSITVNTFTYDTAGNLLTVSENGVVKDEYTYEDNNWQDLLTEFNGTTINYDLSGNPLNWYNGNTYTDLSWVMGRQLESMTVQKDTEELDISYSYDMSGIRSSKTVVIREVEAHTHEYTSVVTTPTCTTAGYTTYTCECGESYVDNLVDALGHNYVASGNVYTCSRCGDSYTGHEHSYTEETTEPTCTEAGYTIYTCSCGDSYTVDLPALGHDYVLVNQSGTIGTYQCSRCGHTYSATIPVNPPTEEYSLRNTAATVEYHEYIYASGRLMRETITTTDAEGNDTTQILDFIYGSGSTPLALVYTNGTATPVTYYYVTNIQGDVVKMVNASGTTVASYTYDAWGKVLSAEGDMAEVNPIRYRGYYYDAETELYYLQSRYYDPDVRRFINADGVATTGQGFTGYNMFAYCGNCPVARIDLSGNAWWGTNTVAVADGEVPNVILTASDNGKPKYGPSSDDLLNDLMANGSFPEHVGPMYLGVECAGYYINDSMPEWLAVAMLAGEIALTVVGAKAVVKIANKSVQTIAKYAIKAGEVAIFAYDTFDAIESLTSPLDKESYYLYRVTTVWCTTETVYSGAGNTSLQARKIHRSVSYYIWENDSEMDPYFMQVSCETTEVSCVLYGG